MHKKIAEDTTEWIGNLSVKIGKQTDAIRTLSGGNAQKVVIAKWLNTDPELIVLKTDLQWVWISDQRVRFSKFCTSLQRMVLE